jgi:flagellar protein FlaJ
MEMKKIHWIGIGVSLVTIASAMALMGTRFFFFLIGIAVLIGIFPFVFTAIKEVRETNEKEQMFLEFARNLVESVKTGTPVSKSIINLRNKSYGVLSPHIKKLANQISLGISLNHALKTLSQDVNNKTISRALTLIGQAERAGGNIGEILESVAEAVSMSDKLKKERKATISTLIVQGYIIFFVFIIIVLVMQYRILPMLSGIGGIGTEAAGFLGGAAVGTPISPEELSSSFLYMLLVQGLFSGLTIGKLAEGSIKAGMKHSFTLMLISFLVSAGSNLLFGG